MESRKQEVRFLKACSLRAVGNTLTGYAAVYDSDSEWMGFTETIRKGAFDRALREKQNVILTYQHDPSKLLARTSSGTLRLHSDSTGLAVEADLPNTPLAQEIRELVQRKDLSGMSFSFNCPQGGDSWNGERRELLDVDLGDVSIVTTPAYSATSVMARAFPSGIPAEVRSHIDAKRPTPAPPAKAAAKTFDSDEARLSFVNGKLGLPANSKRSIPMYNDRFPLSQSLKAEIRRFMLYGEHRDLLVNGTAANFVPEQFNATVLAQMKATDALFDPAVCNHITSATGAPLDLASPDDTANAATIIGEGQPDDQHENDPLFHDKIQLAQAPLYDSGIVKVSIALMQDAFVDVSSMLSTAFAGRLARGIGPDLVEELLDGAKLGRTAEGDPNADSTDPSTQIGYPDLLALRLSVNSAYRTGKCFWLMNDTTLTGLDALCDKNGRPLLPQTYAPSGRRVILGFEVGICPSLPDPGVSLSGPIGSIPLLFGNTGYFCVRTVAGEGRLIRLSERYAEIMEVGFKNFARVNSVLLANQGNDSPVKYLQMGVSA